MPKRRKDKFKKKSVNDVPFITKEALDQTNLLRKLIKENRENSK